MNKEAVEAALRSLIAQLDYDLHKSLECDEETGENRYPEHAETFIAAYQEASK